MTPVQTPFDVLSATCPLCHTLDHTVTTRITAGRSALGVRQVRSEVDCRSAGNCGSLSTLTSRRTNRCHRLSCAAFTEKVRMLARLGVTVGIAAGSVWIFLG